MQTTQLASLDAEADRTERSGVDVRLRRLARQADLSSARCRTADHRLAARPGLAVRAAVRLSQRRRHPAPRLGRAGVAARRRVRARRGGPRPAGAEPAAAAAGARAGRGHRAAVADPRAPGARPGRGPPARRRHPGRRAGRADGRRGRLSNRALRPAGPRADGGRATDPPEGAGRGQRRGDRGGRAGGPRDRGGRAGSGPLHRRRRIRGRRPRWPSGRPCCAVPGWSPDRSSTSPRRTWTWCAG